MRILTFIFILFTCLSVYSSTTCSNEDCGLKNTLKSGWEMWEPYKYIRNSDTGKEVTGLDVEFIKELSKVSDIDIDLKNMSWKQQVDGVKYGTIDLTNSATYTEERSKFAYFSIPYRFEENSLFISRNSTKNISFDNIPEFLAQVRLQNFRLGIKNGFQYADERINKFIASSMNRDIINRYNSDLENLKALLKGEIDGFMTDRIVGANVILKNKSTHLIQEISLNIKTPIHFIFSKKTISLNMVDQFNKFIEKVINSARYKQIVRSYLYPVFLLQTIEADWFYIIGVIASISFAIAGLAIGSKINATLFGTLIIAILPSVGGGIMRDVMINKDTISIILDPSYMYYAMITVFIGFFFIRFLMYYKDRDEMITDQLYEKIIIICDTIGQSIFIVIGVSIVIMYKIDPIELWGPVFAFLTSYGGCIVRDAIYQDKPKICTLDIIVYEISLVWGLIFSIILKYNSYNPNPYVIKYSAAAVIIGAFITRMLCHYFEVSNLKFKNQV